MEDDRRCLALPPSFSGGRLPVAAVAAVPWQTLGRPSALPGTRPSGVGPCAGSGRPIPGRGAGDAKRRVGRGAPAARHRHPGCARGAWTQGFMV